MVGVGVLLGVRVAVAVFVGEGVGDEVAEAVGVEVAVGVRVGGGRVGVAVGPVTSPSTTGSRCIADTTMVGVILMAVSAWVSVMTKVSRLPMTKSRTKSMTDWIRSIKCCLLQANNRYRYGYYAEA